MKWLECYWLKCEVGDGLLHDCYGEGGSKSTMLY